jgi:hypothetical protein
MHIQALLIYLNIYGENSKYTGKYINIYIYIYLIMLKNKIKNSKLPHEHSHIVLKK